MLHCQRVGRGAAAAATTAALLTAGILSAQRTAKVGVIKTVAEQQ